MSEKFCLRWNDFENNIGIAFRELRDDKDFFDVTLACDDEQIQAHKVILSACSPFFRNILRRNPHQHPLLYLKGVKYTDLQSVLNFMYHGEVNVAQEELNSFLAVAEDLRVKGLTQTQSGTKSSRKPPTPAIKSTPHPSQVRDKFVPSPAPVANSHPSPPATDEDDIQEVSVKSEPLPFPPPVALKPQQDSHKYNHSVATAEDHDQVIAADSYDDYGQYSEDQFQEDQLYQGDTQGGLGTGDMGNEGYNFEAPSDLLQYLRKDEHDQKFYCTLCEKFSHKLSSCTRNHVESQHFPNYFAYSCDLCEMTFGTKTTLNLHRSRKHKPKNR